MVSRIAQIAALPLLLAAFVSSIHCLQDLLEPKLLPVVQQVERTEGSNATLACHIESGDLSSIAYRWFKDGKQIEPNIESQGRYKIDRKADDYASLKILQLSANDSGTYTCEARNKYGSDRKETKLDVKLTLRWLEKPNSNVKTSIGSQLKVPCEVSGNVGQVEWRRARVNAFHQRRQSELAGDFEVIGPELQIRSAALSDAGFYECLASDGSGKELKTLVNVEIMGE